MSEFKDNVVIPDQQPSFPFIFNEQEFRVWAWKLDGEEDIYTLCLAKVVPQRGGGYGVANVHATSVNASMKDEGQIRALFETVFLPEVNKYLANLKEEQADMTFPSAGTQTEQFNWFITKALTFDGEKLSLLK